MLSRKHGLLCVPKMVFRFLLNADSKRRRSAWLFNSSRKRLIMQTPFVNDDSLSLSRIMVVGESRRNPFAAQAEAAMRDFAQKWNVLQLPNFEHYCTMNSYLFP